jgi:hypothetical protein
MFGSLEGEKIRGKKGKERRAEERGREGNGYIFPLFRYSKN